MGIDRTTTLFKGPGHIILNGTAFVVSDNITVKIADELWDVGSNGYGVIDRRRKDRKVVVTFTPLEWNNLGLLYPYASMQIGEPIYGATDTPLEIVPRNGANSGLVLANVAVTKMPQAVFASSKLPMGQMEITGIIANNSEPTSDASYWSLRDVGVLPAYDLTKIRNGIYTWSWGVGEGALTNIGVAEGGITVDADLAIDWDQTEGYGSISASLTGLVATASLTPVGLSLAQVLAAVGGPIGAAPAKKDFVIKAGAATVATIPNCQLITGEAAWGNTNRRVGALQFKSVRTAAAGALANLWTFTA